MRQIALSSLIALSCSACAIHPIPSDVTGGNYKTSDIVLAIRCEVRTAVLDAMANNLQQIHDSRMARLLKESDAVPAFDRRGLLAASSKGQEFLRDYDNIIIAYEFSFDMTISNKHEIGLEVGQLVTRGAVGFGASEKFDRSRQNVRTFRVVDDFDKLTRKLTRSTCEKTEQGENLIFPITGKIGMGEPIRTFFELYKQGSLRGPTSDGDNPRLTEALDFTTEVRAGISPSVGLNALHGVLTIAKVSGETSVGRLDKHKVDFAISLPPDVVPGPPTIHNVFITNPGFGTAASSKARGDSSAKSAQDKPSTDIRERKAIAIRRAFDAIERNQDRLFPQRLQTIERRLNNQ